jgi:hypothetical protein
MFDFAFPIINELAALQTERGNLVQPLKKPIHSAAYPYGTNAFHSLVGNSFPNCQQQYKVVQNL